MTLSKGGSCGYDAFCSTACSNSDSERAVASHPAVYDVVVAGRPSERWGNEVVAIVQFAEGRSATDEELADACKTYIAKYKIPKAFIRVDKVLRSPSGKADYRWAKEVAAKGAVPA